MLSCALNSYSPVQRSSLKWGRMAGRNRGRARPSGRIEGGKSLYLHPQSPGVDIHVSWVPDESFGQAKASCNTLTALSCHHSRVLHETCVQDALRGKGLAEPRWSLPWSVFMTVLMIAGLRIRLCQNPGYRALLCNTRHGNSTASHALNSE